MNLPTQLSCLLACVEASLLKYPQVVGVGWGWKEMRGAVTDIAAWRVYVSEKLSRTRLHRTELIPPELAGIATDVLPVKTGAPVAGIKSNQLPALRAGATVSNLKGVFSNDARAGSGLGTVGFLAALNEGRAGEQLVLVSNRHVLLAHGARQGELIYQPRYTQYEDRCYFPGETLNPIAEILDEGCEGNYVYSYPGESACEYFIDCATARILDKKAQPLLSPSGRHGRHFNSLARAHELDVFAGRELRVHKAGQQGARGRIVDVMAPVISANGQRRENNIVIRAEASEAGFAAEGDSGALIVDHFDRAVGLLWGRSLSRKSEAFACHIHPVIARLNVTPLAYDLDLQG